MISARLPAARSVSIAAYVLAGSRLETSGQVGVAHFMEHLTFKGTKAYPTTRAISEAIEGVGGSFNAATDRESTVYWVRVPRREVERAMDVIGELIVRPTLDDADIQSERAVIIEEIRSYLDDPSEYCQILFQTGDVRRRAARPRDLRRGGGHPGRSRRRRSTTSGGPPYRPANTVVAVVGDLGHEEAVGLAATAFGTGNGVVPGLRAGARAARRSARPHRQARHEPGAALRRRPGAPPRPPRQLDPGGPQRRARRRDEQPAVPVGARGARPRLRRVVRAGRLRRRRRARGLGRGRPGPDCRRRSRRSSSSSPACATSSVPEAELDQGQALPVRRARAADGRHPPRGVVDRRPGGAPRPGPDARRGARRGRRGRRAGRPAARRPAVPRRSSCGWRRSRRPATCAASSRASGCRHERGHGDQDRPRRRPGRSS